MKSISSFTIIASGSILMLAITHTQPATAYQNTNSDQQTTTSNENATQITPPQNNAKQSSSPQNSTTSETASQDTIKIKSPKPIDMAFMYKGIGKFVTPDDQVKVMDLLESAKTLGPDGAQLILEDIDRRVPNGDGFDYDGIMWSNKNNEFATIDVHAKPGKVPEDWPGLIAPPFEFPPDATWLLGKSGNLSWFGSIPMSVRVDTSGFPELYIKSYVNIHQQIAEATRDPNRIINKYRADQDGTLNLITVKPEEEDRPEFKDYQWKSADGKRWFRLIGSWPFGMDENPNGEWLFLYAWSTSNGRNMRITHLWISQLPLAGYTLPKNINDLFSVYSMYPQLRQYGIYDVTNGGNEKVIFSSQ